MIHCKYTSWQIVIIIIRGETFCSRGTAVSKSDILARATGWFVVVRYVIKLLRRFIYYYYTYIILYRVIFLMDSPGGDLSIGARINQVGIWPRFLIFCLTIDSSRTVRTSYNILHNIIFLSLQRVLLFISKTWRLVSQTRRCGTCM